MPLISLEDELQNQLSPYLSLLGQERLLVQPIQDTRGEHKDKGLLRHMQDQEKYVFETLDWL